MAPGPPLEVLYGTNPVRECLRAGRRACRRLVLAEKKGRDPRNEELAALARQRACPVETLARDDLSRLARSGQHQGVVLEAEPYPYADFDEIVAAARQAGPGALLLLLDRLQDPQNVGTLLRTAEAVAAQGIVLPEHRAAAITPAVVKASAGATEHLAIGRAKNLVRAIQQLKQAGLWVFGLEEDAAAVPYTQIDWNVPVAVVVGSEGSGVRRLVREHCDGLVQLPMRGQINSLNAAVAGSVVLYEICRQRDLFEKPAEDVL